MSDPKWFFTEEEVKEVFGNLLDNSPHICDLCNFFSGNYPLYAGVRPAKCLNVKSPFFEEEVNDNFTCIEGEW